MEKVVFKDMPGRIKGFTIRNSDESYTIFINSKLNFDQTQQVYLHERYHIDNNDFEKENIDKIEVYVRLQLKG